MALTLPGLVPPRATMASVAPSRLKPSSVPDTTTDLPASTWGPTGSTRSGGWPKSTPAARSFSMNSLLVSRSNHDRIDSAITPPTPGTAARSSAGAFITASSVPNWAARAVEAAGPRCFTPSAVSTLGSGRCRDPSIPASNLRALMAAKPSRVRSCSSVNR